MAHESRKLKQTQLKGRLTSYCHNWSHHLGISMVKRCYGAHVCGFHDRLVCYIDSHISIRIQIIFYFISGLFRDKMYRKVPYSFHFCSTIPAIGLELNISSFPPSALTVTFCLFNTIFRNLIWKLFLQEAKLSLRFVTPETDSVYTRQRE